VPERPQFELDRDRARRHAFKQERDLQAQKAASSRPGQVYHTMTSLADRMTRPGYQNNKADINQLKGLRRDWNRNQKYTPQGMQVSGATTPMGAQDAYMGISRDLRQGNKRAYNKMYPITGGFMDVAEKGGILGTILSQIGKMGKDGGIPTAVGDTIDAQEDYVSKTFGPINIHDDEFIDTENWDERDVTIPPDYPIDEGAFTSLNPFDDSRREAAIMAQYPGKEIEEVTEEYAGPWPHADMPYLSDEAAAIQKEFNTNPYFQNLQDPSVVLPFEKDRRGHPHLETYTPDAGPRLGTASPHDPTEGIRVAPWLTDPNIPMPEELTKGEYLPGQYHDELIEEEITAPIPFDDSGRESGIRGLHKYLKPNKYEDEFRAYIESGGDFMPYHQFERLYEKIYQGKPHALHSWYR
jgi:hypothetical protein